MLKIQYMLGLILVATALSAQTPAITTEHGYRFYHHINKGGQKPQRGESIRAYVNVFIGDTVLSSSRKNLGGTYKYDIAPAGAVLEHYPPIMDAVLLMGIGDSATIFQPLDTAMRRFVPKAVQHISELRFEISLVQIISMEEKARAEQAVQARVAALRQKVEAKVKAISAGTLSEPVTTTKTGLKILVDEAGRGKPLHEGEAVQVHYYGFLTNGTCFENSFDRRQPIAFPAGVGQMIPGFDEGVMSLTHGSKAYLIIPSPLAYGDQEAAGGRIPPNSDLIYYIELL